MATKTAYRSRSQGNYITPNTAEGKKILNYLKNRCEKALDYCLENGLTSVEDFADAIEELTEADGKPGISVEVKHNGLVLSLSDRPEYGSTTGKYMMEHLGEPDDNRFTKTGIEALLDSPRTKTRSKKDDLLDELDDEQPSPKSKSKVATKSKKDDLLDELEDDEPSPSKSKTATKFKKDELLDELEDEEPLPRAKSKTHTKSKKDEIENWDDDEPLPNSKTKNKHQEDDLEELLSEEPLVKSKALNRSPRDELSELDEFELKEPQPKAKPQTKSHLQNSEREDLSDEELSAKSQAKRKLQTNEGVEVAESLARTPSKTRTSQQRPQGKKSNDQNIDSILDAAVQVSGRTAISGNEVEGTTVSGMSAQVAVLATLIGKKAASQIIEAALGAGKERQVADIVKRLKAQSQRADSLSQRVTNLAEADSIADAMVESEALPIAEPEPAPEQNILPEPDAEFVSTPGMLLAKAVSKVHGKVDKISGRVRDNTSEKTAAIKIDTEASFEEQLVQINEALNRLEKRLDTLEERIEALENKLSLQSKTGVQAADAKVEPPDSSTPSLSDQFVQNGTEIGEKVSLESTIPASSSASATAKKITVTAQNLTQDSQLAATLAKIYSLAEEEANAEGIALEDGVDLGEAKLYVTNIDSSTAVNLKTKEGEEMFSAVQDKTGEWKVTNDFLKPEEKEELDRLKIFQQALNQERLAEMVKRSNQDEVSFTDSQGSRLDFEVEFSDKSKSKGTVKGFNSHSEIVFEASLQKGNLEVLLCDIPPEVVENLLSQQQLAQNQNSNKQEARKTEVEMEI
jgi:ubiquinone biosynthesis protein UbiJ